MDWVEIYELESSCWHFSTSFYPCIVEDPRIQGAMNWGIRLLLFLFPPLFLILIFVCSSSVLYFDTLFSAGTCVFWHEDAINVTVTNYLWSSNQWAMGYSCSLVGFTYIQKMKLGQSRCLYSMFFVWTENLKEKK